MAYSINPSDLVQITVEYLAPNVNIMLNTFHYRLISTTTLTDGQVALNTLINTHFTDTTSQGWAGAWSFVAHTSQTISEVKGQKIWPQRFRATQIATAIQGTRTGMIFPNIVQASILKQVEMASKSSQGAVRVPVGIGGDVMNNLWTTAFTDLMFPLVDFVDRPLATAVPAATWQPVVFHRSAPATSQNVFAATFQPEPRGQRTRVAFRGI